MKTISNFIKPSVFTDHDHNCLQLLTPTRSHDLSSPHSIAVLTHGQLSSSGTFGIHTLFPSTGTVPIHSLLSFPDTVPIHSLFKLVFILAKDSSFLSVHVVCLTSCNSVWGIVLGLAGNYWPVLSTLNLNTKADICSLWLGLCTPISTTMILISTWVMCPICILRYLLQYFENWLKEFDKMFL